MLLLYFLLWTAVAANKEPLYGKIGDKAVLTPASIVNPITSIEWKHGPDLAMEWYGDKTTAYRHFKDRGRLNTLTGALTITGLTSDDSGNYTVEINNKVTSETQLLVISPVSKPTLSLWCEPEMTYCVLTCNGDTTDAELVTYRWTSGDKTWSSTKEHNITKEDNELWFSCAFEKPVSFISSEIVFNPFMEKEPLYGKIGDKAVLTPDSVVNLITSIVWKHGADLAMEWYGGETFSSQHFKDRGLLNTLTGALTITGLTPDDSGNYTVEINNKVTSKTQLLVISPVSKPTLFDWCTMTYCVFTCNGDTTGAEPVTYWWTSGDMTWSSTKEHKIRMMEKEMWYSWFSCAFENPVSINSSEKVFNPFIRNLIIFTVILFLVFCIIIITFRHKGIIDSSCKWVKEVLTWMTIFIPVPLFIIFMLIIIISYLEYTSRQEDLTWMVILTAVFGVILVVCIIIIIIIYLKRRARFWALTRMFNFIPLCILAVLIIILYFKFIDENENLTWMIILSAVFGVILVVCIIISIIIYLKPQARFWGLTRMFNFITLVIPAGCIITIIYLEYKGGNTFDEGLTRTFILLQVLGVILVGDIIIIIYLIYKGITFFRRKRREREAAERKWQGEAERRWQEYLERLDEGEAERAKQEYQDWLDKGEAAERARQEHLEWRRKGEDKEKKWQELLERRDLGESTERRWQEYLEWRKKDEAERARQELRERRDLGAAERIWQVVRRRWNRGAAERIWQVVRRRWNMGEAAKREWQEYLERLDEGEAAKREWQEFKERRDEAFPERWDKDEAAERIWQEFLERRDLGEAAERRWQAFLKRRREDEAAERKWQERLERLDKEMSEMLPPVQNTSPQDPTSVEVQDTSNGTEMLEMVPLKKTSTQDTTSTVPPETSKETERSTTSPDVPETSTQDQETAESPDPSNETEESAIIPDVPETCRLLIDEQTADLEDETQS